VLKDVKLAVQPITSSWSYVNATKLAERPAMVVTATAAEATPVELALKGGITQVRIVSETSVALLQRLPPTVTTGVTSI
jgi:hypothetical protein